MREATGEVSPRALGDLKDEKEPTIGKDRRAWTRGGHPSRSSHISKDPVSGRERCFSAKLGKG